MLWSECHHSAHGPKHDWSRGHPPCTASVHRKTGLVTSDIYALTADQYAARFEQIQMVLSDIDIRAIKIGMLFDVANTKAVVRSIQKHYSSSSLKPPIICDPVCVSTSGHTLLHPEALDVLISDLFPLTTIITPNKSEAETLLSQRGFPTSINTLEEMMSAVNQMILAFASHAVLLKGGHINVTTQDIKRLLEVKQDVQVINHGPMEENMEILLAGEKTRGVEIEPQLVVDVLQERKGGTTLFVRPRIDSTSTHGTGCTLSAAIACALTQGSTCVSFCAFHHELQLKGESSN